MTPTVEHALAKFDLAPQERKEKIAQMILVELEDVRDEYQEFVDGALEKGLAQSKAGLSRPLEDAWSDLEARMKQKHGSV